MQNFSKVNNLVDAFLQAMAIILVSAVVVGMFYLYTMALSTTTGIGLGASSLIVSVVVVCATIAVYLNKN